MINCTCFWSAIHASYSSFIDSLVDSWGSSSDVAEFFEGSSLSSSQYSMNRLDSGRSFFKKASIMFSNLYRLSRSLRSSIAVTIWETFSHAASRKTPRFSENVSIRILRSESDSFSTLKQSQRKIKSEENRLTRIHRHRTHLLTVSRERMIQTSLEVSSSFVHSESASSVLLASFDIHQPRHFVS